MPILNGYEASTALRKLEHMTDRHIPIIAMTAEAMKGDRELCLEAGMDDYVSKPIDQQALYDAIQKWPAEVLSAVAECRSRDDSPTKNLMQSASASIQPSADVVAPAAVDDRVIDWDVARKITGNDPELLDEIVILMKAQCPQLMSDIYRALTTSDAVLLQRSGHTLHSSARYFGSHRFADLSLRVEMLGRDASFFDATATVAALEEEMARFLIALEQSTR